MGLFDFFKKKNNEEQQKHELVRLKQADNVVDEAQQEFINDSTANAERIVESFNEKYEGAFDYSEESLVELDELLENFAEFGDQMDDEMKEDLIAQAGSYIFEVARRNFGGKYFWYDQLDQPLLVTGLPHFEISLVAFDKVKMRLENGQEDNIPYFFKGYSDRVRLAKSGDKAMIV
ncbi:hypothetical protein IQ05_00090 [Flavobacterium tiangeerense]|uniref:Uncharacterized protein n=1 Tax=Flavobacterium tiangeerense TaxID=459471 RepID=A0ABY3FNA0_9FLAO|nr:hypothetical protein [Flavobacterium tiangeerense]TWI03161.1 hypothetical protein IQ05_00090 [Flavobacterium tiangeerense]